MTTSNTNNRAIVVGASAGGLHAISFILSRLPANYTVPLMIVQHRMKEQSELMEEILQEKCKLKVKQADEKEAIRPGFVYTAPPDYHLLVEFGETFSLSVDEPVRFSRPAIDVLFETAAAVYQSNLTGVLLTGASNDGSRGFAAIKDAGGTTIAQDPEEAPFSVMPVSAIGLNKVDHVLRLEGITEILLKIGNSR